MKLSIDLPVPKMKKGFMIPIDIRFYAILLYFASSPLSKLFDSVGIPRELIYILMMLIILLSVILNRQVVTNDTIIFYIFVVPIILYGVINNYYYIDKATNVYSIFLEMLPGYLIVKLSKDNMNMFKRALKLASYITLIYYIPFALISDIGLDYMAYAYWIQLPLCLIFYYAFTEKNIKDIVLSIIGTIALIIFGSRGALLGYILFITYTIIFNSERKVWGIITFLGLLGVVFLNNIEKLIKWLSDKGINSRTLIKIIQGDFTTSTTRVPLYEQCKFYIKESLLTGYGPLGSRSIIIGYPYPHSIVYEIILDFGIILGSIILGYVIFTGIYMILKSKGDYRFLSSLFFITGITRLLVSNSIYYVNYIPITIALYITYRKQLRYTSRRRDK